MYTRYQSVGKLVLTNVYKIWGQLYKSLVNFNYS